METSMKEQIRNFVVETYLYNEGTVDDDEPLFENDIIDSIGLPRLIVFLEETFSIQINMMDVTIENFKSIGTITQTVKSKINTICKGLQNR